MLIDQNIYIDNDPIGHCCRNGGEVILDGMLICRECEATFIQDPIRFTLPEERHTKEEWQEITKKRFGVVYKEQMDRLGTYD